jgi:hypothetical protein
LRTRTVVISIAEVPMGDGIVEEYGRHVPWLLTRAASAEIKRLCTPMSDSVAAKRAKKAHEKAMRAACGEDEHETGEIKPEEEVQPKKKAKKAPSAKAKAKAKTAASANSTSDPLDESDGVREVYFLEDLVGIIQTFSADPNVIKNKRALLSFGLELAFVKQVTIADVQYTTWSALRMKLKQHASTLLGPDSQPGGASSAAVGTISIVDLFRNAVADAEPESVDKLRRLSSHTEIDTHLVSFMKTTHYHLRFQRGYQHSTTAAASHMTDAMRSGAIDAVSLPAVASASLAGALFQYMHASWFEFCRLATSELYRTKQLPESVKHVFPDEKSLEMFTLMRTTTCHVYKHRWRMIMRMRRRTRRSRRIRRRRRRRRMRRMRMVRMRRRKRMNE